MAWDTILASIGGAIIGAFIASYISYRIYKKQVLRGHYNDIALRIQKAITLSPILNNPGFKDSDRFNAKLEIDTLLNQIWALSLIGLPDKIFQKLDNLFPKSGSAAVTPQNLNQFYFELRKSLNRWTKVDLQNILNRFISISHRPSKEETENESQKNKTEKV
ncbi:MAG: hypothetical protein WC460_04825 [Patescibacteria group bacterium]